MKRRKSSFIGYCPGLIVWICISGYAGENAVLIPSEWPRIFVRNGITNTIYQLQLESWDNFTLKASAAVSVCPEGALRATLGVIKIEAKTRVDRAERIVYLEDVQITHAAFPAAPEQAEAYLQNLRLLAPKQVRSISLDRIEASLAILEAKHTVAGELLKNDPPNIIFSTRPAVLILLDGPPNYRPVEETGVERMCNTRALLVRDRAGEHYLHLFDGYVKAPVPGGPWSVAIEVPNEVKKAETLAIETKQVDLLVGQENPKTKRKPSLKSTRIPKIYLATSPTELITTIGEPQWALLPPTRLLCATNTVAHVFKELRDQKIYVLISGRWFRADSISGPWEFVPATSLPKDFANISDNSAQENIKASVPGTRQAREAVIANSIPQMSKVDRTEAQMSPPPSYEGAPQLNAIGQTPLYYIVNSDIPVIRVTENSWYACENGVWFTSTSPDGPWILAISVPPVIYSIPPGSPLHYVTYVRIYNLDPDYVWTGTTPGYYGAMVDSDGVVVYGTGYVYLPYVGTNVSVSYPVTYGYGANPCWTPWAGWSIGFAAGWARASDWKWWCVSPPAPYWVPYAKWCYGAHYDPYGGVAAWGPYGWAGTSGYVYHHEGPCNGVSHGDGGYDAWTGNQWASGYGSAYNSTTGTRVAGKNSAVENVYRGNSEGRDTHISGVRDEIDLNEHVIAGSDGNFYRPDERGGWDTTARLLTPTGNNFGSVHENTGGEQQWTKWLPPASEQGRLSPVGNEFEAEQVGAQREQSFEANHPSFSGGVHVSGGGFRR